MHDDLLANFRSYWLGFHRLSGDADGITCYHSGVPLGMYNGVLRVVEGTTIDAAKRIFVESPWVWWVGPDSYSGRSLDAAHNGLGITGTQYGLVVGHLTAVLEELGVSETAISAVQSTLADVRPSIVERADA